MQYTEIAVFWCNFHFSEKRYRIFKTHCQFGLHDLNFLQGEFLSQKRSPTSQSKTRSRRLHSSIKLKVRVLSNVIMSQTNDDYETDIVDMFESDGDTLYRLPTPTSHIGEEDDPSHESDARSNFEAMPTRKRNAERSTIVQLANKSVTVGPNSVHTNEGARENISDRSLCNE